MTYPFSTDAEFCSCFCRVLQGD
uniref:Uncharacterized protein n=1 Tax=Arundo donax TaxID=35708 RepID=A0A0A9EZQ1_ARUDO